MIVRSFLAVGLFFLTNLSAHSQIIRITDQDSGDPIEGVTLVSEDPKGFEVTNANGEVDISSFKGSSRIQVQSFKYKSDLKSYSALESQGFQWQLEATNIHLVDIVVSATRWSQNSGDSPYKVSGISTKSLELQNPQTAADLLGISGKVFIQKSQQGGGSPMIRGFATNRLLYSVDGVRMNTAIFRSGNIQNVISLDPFAMEKVEVLFGPGSVLYGSDAIGGVMSFQTLTPQFSTQSEPLIHGKATTRYSSANTEKTAHFDVNVGWKKWALLTSFSANDFEDLRMGSNGPEEYLRPYYVQHVDSMDVVVSNEDLELQRPSAYSQINMMQKLRFQPSKNWNVQYAFHYSETSSYSRYDRHIRYKNGLPRYGEWYYGPQKWIMNHLEVAHKGKNVAYDEIKIAGAQQFFEESRVSRDINDPNREIRTEKVDAYSINIDFTKAIGKSHQFFYGTEAVWNIVTSTGLNENIDAGTTAIGPSRYPQATWASYAIYISDQWKLGEKIVIQGGGRYNQFLMNAEFDTTFYPFPFTSGEFNKGALTGTFGLVYRPTQKWVISANAATAFRSPNVDDLGKVFDSEPGTVVVPNPGVEAEYAYNGDFNIAKVFGDVVKIDLGAYYTLLNNALVRRDFTLNGQDSMLYDGQMSKIQAVQNAAKANVYGFQAGIEVKLSKGFGFSSDFNFQKGEEELDDGSISPSRHAAPWFGVTRLSYTYKKFNLQFYAQYSGSKSFDELPLEEKAKDYLYAVDENGNPYSPGWYTLNFKAMHQIGDHIGISAGIENLTDQRYRPYSSGLVAPGRNFIFSLRFKF